MSWSGVFGEAWFWVAAALIWARAALTLCGAPLKLIGEARRGTAEGRTEGLAPAAFALDLVRWRLGPGHPCPRGILPLRWPLLGGAGAWLLASAVFGDLLSLALLLALGPPLAAGLALEPRLMEATDAARGAGPEAPRLAGFADALEQAWRLRMASVAIAVLLTASAAALTRTVAG